MTLADSKKTPGASPQVYLVGGAVRDQCLGRPVRERDYVVVGSTPAALLAEGFRPVGKDFPVFLHPVTQEEYALARTERKVGRGYHGFQFNAAPEVRLEEDLARRDLTINAMAQDADGRILDPFGGQQDLQDRVLRHVSPAFVEDPVRLLRVARLAAQLADYGFTVAPTTHALLQELVQQGELDSLVPERVWSECEKALRSPAPLRFFEILLSTGALKVLFPELERLFGIPQPARYHPEIDTGRHTWMVLEQATRLSPSPEVRFAALVHDLGKGTTPAAILPSHHGHEERSVQLIAGLGKRLRIPRRYLELATHVARQHGRVHRIFELRPETLLTLLESVDVLRRPEQVEPFLLALEADYRGRANFEERPYPQADYFRQAVAATRNIHAAPFLAQGLQGTALGAALRQARLHALTALR
jgi:tRNA nucleotidyltransferase (CCA-adding enzyme)